MKNKKTLIITISLVAVLAIIAIIIVLLSGKEKYRVIKVQSNDGDVTYERDNKTKDIVKGMNLISGDSVTTGSDAALELLADSDKHIVAEADTCFFIDATGNEKAGKITIKMVYGTALYTIDNKLNDNSEFRVKTPNATMSVRGTEFKVSYNPETDITGVEVISGLVRIRTDDEEADVGKGESIYIIGSRISETPDDMGITGDTGDTAGDSADTGDNPDGGDNTDMSYNDYTLDDAALAEAGLRVCDTGWFWSSSSGTYDYYKFFCIIENNSDERCCHPEVFGTVKDGDGEVLTEFAEIGNYIMPGDRAMVLATFAIDTSYTADELRISYNVEYSQFASVEDKPAPSNNDIQLIHRETNINENDVTIKSDIKNLYGKNIDTLMVYVVLKKDGKIVYVCDAIAYNLEPDVMESITHSIYGEMPDFNAVEYMSYEMFNY